MRVQDAFAQGAISHQDLECRLHAVLTAQTFVPSVLRIESDYGRVSLDFSRATFETPVVDVELQLRFGRAKIIVPADAVIDLDGLQAKWKRPRYEIPGHAPSAGPLIRISESMEFGRLTVRHSRL